MFIFVWSQISKIKAFIYVLSSRERIHQCIRIKDNNAPGVPEEKYHLKLKNATLNLKQSVINTFTNSTYYRGVSTVTE